MLVEDRMKRRDVNHRYTSRALLTTLSLPLSLPPSLPLLKNRWVLSWELFPLCHKRTLLLSSVRVVCSPTALLVLLLLTS